MGFVGLCGSSSRLPLSVDDDHGLVTLASYALERPQLDVSLHDGVRKLAANQALCIKDLGMACTQLSEPKHEDSLWEIVQPVSVGNQAAVKKGGRS